MARETSPRTDPEKRPTDATGTPRHSPQDATARPPPDPAGTRTGVTPGTPGDEDRADAPITAPQTAPGREAPKGAAIASDGMRAEDRAATGRPGADSPAAGRRPAPWRRPPWQWGVAGAVLLLLLFLIF